MCECVGHVLYKPGLLFPRLENRVYGYVVVRVPSVYLSWENRGICNREIWGTDVYSDDSDVVASAFKVAVLLVVLSLTVSTSARTRRSPDADNRSAWYARSFSQVFFGP
jgi:hypothetical protein